MTKSLIKTAKQKAVINIRITSNWIAYNQNLFMSKFNLSMAQFNILRILRGAKSKLSINTIKERMIEKSPNTTRLIDKLFENKFINKIRCDNDKRIIFVKINKKGLSVLNKIDDEFENLFYFADNLSEDEANFLNEILDKIRTNKCYSDK